MLGILRRSLKLSSFEALDREQRPHFMSLQKFYFCNIIKNTLKHFRLIHVLYDHSPKRLTQFFVVDELRSRHLKAKNVIYHNVVADMEPML